MGKKIAAKQIINKQQSSGLQTNNTNASSTAPGNNISSTAYTGKKLSTQKRNELNQYIDSLIKLVFYPTSSINDQWSQYLEIKYVIERIQKIESDLTIKPSQKNLRANATTIDAFCKWAADNGATFDGVKISEFSTGGFEYGLEATKPFREGEQFMIIPKNLIFSLDSVNEFVAVSEMPMIDSMLNVKLAFSLVVEKLLPNSFWKPYIDMLPERYSTVMNFSINEMQELKGSNVLSAALNQCKNIARQYAFIHKFMQKLRPENPDPVLNIVRERFTYDLYCWAVSTIMTRQNSIPKEALALELSDETQNVPALIPLWDMANHINGTITSVYNVNKSRIESSTLKDLKKGDQILIFYGVRNNANLLVHNGFVYPENENDSVSIRLGLSPTDPLLDKRNILLKALKLPKNLELDVLPSPNYISPELLAFARIFNMNEEQLDHWISSDRSTDLLHGDCALDTLLESKSWTFLKMRLIILLKSFPTTLQEDLVLLENHRKGQNKLGHIKSMLVQYRVLEKRILTDSLEYVEQRTKP